MRVKITIPKKRSPFPDLLLYLKSLPEKFSFHTDYDLRHPYNILHLSIRKIFKKVQEILKILGTIGESEFRSDSVNLMDCTTAMLHNFASLTDDLLSIFLVSEPPTLLKPKTLLTWLQNEKPKFALDFQSDANQLISYWKNQVNILKHNNTFLRGILGEIKGSYCYGYFVEGVDNDIVGPHPQIHSLFLGKKTAYSYNYHLRINMLYFYVILDKAFKHLKRFHKSKGLRFKIDQLDPLNLEYMKSVVEAIENLPLLFFPDEAQKPYPCFKQDYSGLSITFPHTDNILQYPSMRFGFNFTPEEHLLKHYLPYSKEL